MEYFKFILYGLIQGLTEFIPVSSSAHLKIISLFFGIDDPGISLSAIIQLGSVFALAWYFKDEIFKLKHQLSKKDFNFLIKKNEASGKKISDNIEVDIQTFCHAVIVRR